MVNQQHQPVRRGTAILLALAAMVLVLVIVTGLATRAAALQHERMLDRSTVLAHELVNAAEPLIQQWLTDIADSVVLSSEAGTPEIAIHHGVIATDTDVFELRITAWDQQGMLPVSIARSNSPLRLALPFAVQDAVHDVTVRTEELTGLDQWLPRQTEEPSFPVFPAPSPAPHRPPQIYVAGGSSFDASSSPNALSSMAEFSPSLDKPAIGAYVATHPDQSTTGRDRSIAINVNTAPMPLIESALREAGRGGSEVIRAARDEGIAVNLSQMPESSAERVHDRPLPTFTGRSDFWAVRIDGRVNNIQQSWWRIYQRSESNESQPWKCVQSIAIPY
ncbi:MAG: hypothetical protein EA377_04210 [Phycisphaerales bacterium]|nr:MAG: hypothetical protein EA377_04210 [Phycisphaerales bacterium]